MKANKRILLTLLIVALPLVFSFALFACNTSPSVTVDFITDGGSIVPYQTVKSGKRAIKPLNPSKIDSDRFSFTFAGWYSDAEFTKEYDFNNAVTKDITLYANFIEEDKLLTYSLNELTDSYTVTGVKDKDKDVLIVEIPDAYNRKPVTAIGNLAFKSCYNLRRITLPSSMTIIGNSAFEGCGFLKEITLPSSLTIIGASAFKSCQGITSVTLPSSLTIIGASAFDYCMGLTSITLPNSLTFIGDSAFYNCNRLNKIYCEAAEQQEGWSNDWKGNCKATLNWGCKSVTTHSEYDYIIYNEEIYLTKYKGSGGEVTIPDSIDGIAVAFIEDAFRNKTNVISVNIASGITHIGAWAFNGCHSLESITLPSSLTSIGESAFSGCISLASVTLPSSLTSIGESAFRLCSSLKSISLPNGITKIENSVFNGCSGLVSLTLPNSLKSIGRLAFSGCSSLESITLPSSLTSIGELAFSYCRSLASITLPSSLTSFGALAFSDCSGLTNIYCEAESQPTSWDSYWKIGCTANVEWGYKA